MTVSEFQASSSQQGKAFEDTVVTLLLCAGWTVDRRLLKIHDSEIDIVATDPHGVVWWIECKGSWRGKQQGSKRSDTVKKAIGVAWILSTVEDRPPYMLVTSHLPSPTSSTGRMLESAVQAGLFTCVRVVPNPFFDEPDVDLEADE
jgi:Holliday junction resolvase-like predicted endonuclease